MKLLYGMQLQTLQHRLTIRLPSGIDFLHHQIQKLIGFGVHNLANTMQYGAHEIGALIGKPNANNMIRTFCKFLYCNCYILYYILLSFF